MENTYTCSEFETKMRGFIIKYKSWLGISYNSALEDLYQQYGEGASLKELKSIKREDVEA